MQILRTLRTLSISMILILVQSCSTIESTVDSTLDSISEAGDFIYDSVNFWEDEEPEQSEAVVIEEAVEVLCAVEIPAAPPDWVGPFWVTR